MARAYSLDLRERVVAAVAAGQSCRSVASAHGDERLGREADPLCT
jgi:transposase